MWPHMLGGCSCRGLYIAGTTVYVRRMVCIWAYTNDLTHTCIQALIHAHTVVYVRRRVCVHEHTQMLLRTIVCTYSHTHTHTHTVVYIRMRDYMCDFTNMLTWGRTLYINIYSETSHTDHLHRSTTSLYRPAFHVTEIKSTVSFLSCGKFDKSATSLHGPHEFTAVSGRFREVLLYMLLFRCGSNIIFILMMLLSVDSYHNTNIPSALAFICFVTNAALGIHKTFNCTTYAACECVFVEWHQTNSLPPHTHTHTGVKSFHILELPWGAETW